MYICLFTCASTRAVHLEIVQDLTVESFLLAFRRFSSRKSLPRQMLSDNTSTYLAEAEDLQKLFESERDPEMPKYHMAFYLQTGTVVWWILGTPYRIN